MLADLVTVINLPVKKSAGRNGGGVNLLVVLVTVTKSTSQDICWQIIRKGKSADRFIDCHQICQLGNLHAEMGGICL